MSKMQCLLILATFCVILHLTESGGDFESNDNSDDLHDFDFESEPAGAQDDYSNVEPNDGNKLDAVFDDLNEPDSFAEKEKRIRNALLRSTTDKNNSRMLTQILPILRSMSRPQKTALVAIVSAQASMSKGSELSFEQVSRL